MATPSGAVTLPRPRRAPPAPTEKRSLFPPSIAGSITESCGRLTPVFSSDVSRIPGKISVSLPERADLPFELEEAHTEVRIKARLAGARSVPREVSKGYVVYRDALPNGVDLIHVPTPTGTEDVLTISGPDTTALSYEVELGDKVAGLRLFANTLEFLDADGMPRLRISPPYLVDADVKRHDATLSLSGCTADTSRTPPWEHPVVAAGARSCTVIVSWKQTKPAYPALLDPSWTSTASLATERAGHVAGLLGDGTVIVAGGASYDTLLASAERFRLGIDGTGTWAAAAPMKTSRLYPLSAAQPNRFYVINGYNDWFCTNAGSAEFFSISTSDWTVTGPEAGPFRLRDQNGTATLLADGRILILGGDRCDSGRPTNWVDLYDPLLDRWSTGPDLPAARAEHTAVGLGDGRVFVAGGRENGDYNSPDFVTPTFLFDPRQNQWSGGPPLNHGRSYHGSASLSATSTYVLVFGGYGDDFASPTLRWTGGSSFRTIAPGAGREWDRDIGWAALRDGSVLSVWGTFASYTDVAVFNPVTEQWSSMGGVTPRYEFTVTDLGSKALVTGGIDVGGNNIFAEADLYTYAESTAQICGDGIRDPVREECDLGGAVGARALCTSDCRVRDQLAVSQSFDGGVSPGRTLGEGRHPIAVSATGSFGVAFVDVDAKPIRLALTSFSNTGIPSDMPVSISTGSTPLLMSHPVVAPVPGGKFAVAYTEFDGDGDELGIALRLVDPAAAPSGKPAHANTTTVFSQYDADLIATTSGLVAAWIDDADASTSPKLKYRTFGFDLTPTSGELPLAATSTTASEGDVALAAWGTSWAAAWRADENGLETLRIRAGSTSWSIGTYLPGPVGSRPALAELDATHLLVAYVEGTDPAETGTANSSKLRVALLDTAAPGSVTPLDVPTSLRPGLSQDQPNAARAGNQVFIAWRSESPVGGTDAPNAEELWLKQIVWSGATLDVSATEIPLPRSLQHRVGDQRRVALAGGPLAPVGGQLVSAFDDFGKVFGAGEFEADVVVEAIPVPLLRLP